MSRVPTIVALVLLSQGACADFEAEPGAEGSLEDAEGSAELSLLPSIEQADEIVVEDSAALFTGELVHPGASSANHLEQAEQALGSGETQLMQATAPTNLLATCEQDCLASFRACRRACPPPTVDGPTCWEGCSQDYSWCLEDCIPPPDSDGDGVPDNQDNCPQVANANQANCDGDAQGNACDSFNGRETLQSTTRTLNYSYRDQDFCGREFIDETLWKRYIEVQTITRTYLRDYCDATPDSTYTTQQTGTVQCDVEYWPERPCSVFDPDRIPFPHGNPPGWCLALHF
jgi:hypothetical protein